MHWHSQHVTTLVMITYRKNPVYDPCLQNLKPSKNTHYYISNDGTHDTLYVQQTFLLHQD